MKVLHPLAFALAFFCTAAAPPEEPVLQEPVLIENVAQIYLIPMQYEVPLTDNPLPTVLMFEYEAFLVHSDGRLTFADLSNIQYVEMLQQSPATALVYYAGPNQLRTCYIGTAGLKREIITSCAGLSDAACIKKHDRMVEAMMTAHPKTADCP